MYTAGKMDPDLEAVAPSSTGYTDDDTRDSWGGYRDTGDSWGGYRDTGDSLWGGHSSKVC